MYEFATQLKEMVEPITNAPDPTNIDKPPFIDHDANLAPLTSALTDLFDRNREDSPLPKRQSTKERDAWCRSTLPTAVNLAIENPHGKISKNHSFTSEICFRHIVPFIASGWLSRRDERRLGKAYPLFRKHEELQRRYGHYDFRKLRDGLPPQIIESDNFMPELANLVTSCILHYKCDVATAVRFIGGQHTAANINVPAVLAKLKRANLPKQLIDDYERTFVVGAPNVYVADGTEQNFKEYLCYGNHKSVLEEPSVTMKAFEKDSKKGFSLPCHPLLIMFTPHAQRTPIAMVNLGHRYKKARPVFDSSLHPFPWSMSINDHTNLDNEPEIIFALSFVMFLTWVWNLRITYPDIEIYLGDDDVSGAFRRIKYNPNLVALHACILLGLLFLMTGQTFGDRASPANWETIAKTRQQYARYLWTQDDTIEKGKTLIPELLFAPVDSNYQYPKIYPDSLNTGVMNSDGTRQPPPYPHHVDDCYYADVQEHFSMTVIASIMALYVVLGSPSVHNPDAVSWDKFNAMFSHTRRARGYDVDSRKMMVFYPWSKREILSSEIDHVLSLKTVGLRSIAQILGQLEDACSVHPWARPLFWELQNTFSRFLRQRCHALKNYRLRQQDKRTYYESCLPNHLKYRIDSLLARDDAAFLWSTKAKFGLPDSINDRLYYIQRRLRDPSYEWGISIGYMIPREYFSYGIGDASHDACGGFNEALHYWFSLAWGPEVRRRIKLPKQHPQKIHINMLEFLVILIQIAAMKTRLKTPVPVSIRKTFPNGYPYKPLAHLKTDNMATNNWANTISSKSPRAHLLICVYSLLLADQSLAVNSSHIKGSENELADFLSRPAGLSPLHHVYQIKQQHPKMKFWDFFQPSPELLSLLSLALCGDAKMENLNLPKNLGHFVVACNTTSYSATT